MSEKSSEQQWKEHRKIATLPNNNAPSPELVLARSLEKAKRMKGVVVLIHWDTGTWDEDHSAMKLSDLVWLERMFKVAVDEEIRNP